MIAAIAEELAAGEQRPGYQKTKMADSRTSRSPLKVRLGIMPSYADDDREGMAISGVIEDGPADRAGMRDDDRILWIAETEVNDIYDYMSALSGFEPESQVLVKVRREGQLVALHVILEGSKR